MRATVINVADPFDPLGSRTVSQVGRRQKISRLAPKWKDAPFIATVNGVPHLRKSWHRKVRDGDVVVFTRLPRGGGNNNNGSNPMATILMIAIMVAAPYAATAMLGYTAAAAPTALAAFAHHALTATITVAGMAMVNMIVGVPGQKDQDGPSPTYNLNASGNQARIEGVVPVQYGTMKYYPDLGAQPYSTFSNNEQILHELFVLGQGEFEFNPATDCFIEDSPLNSFGIDSGLEWELVPPGQKLDLFSANVITSVEVSGQTLVDGAPISYTISGSTLTATVTDGDIDPSIVTGTDVYMTFAAGTNVEPPNTAYEIATVDYANKKFTVNLGASGFTGPGTGKFHPILGGKTGFTANPTGTTATRLAVDVACPRGLYIQQEDGDLDRMYINTRFQARKLQDDNENFVDGSGWFDLGSPVLEGRSVTPLRRTFTWTVPAGRYRVRAWRTDDGWGHPHADELGWIGLRAYCQGPQTWPGVTMLALKMTATNNLQGQGARRVSVKATRKVPVWDGTSWSAPVASRNPAWALADICRNTTYGAGMKGKHIDLAALKSLAALWDQRGDRFDGRFDTETTVHDALQKVAFVGRAKCFMQGGKLRTVRDGPATVPVVMWSDRNVISGTFSMEYLMETDATADTLEVEFLSNETWKPQRIVASIGTADKKKTKLQFFGITGRNHCEREAVFQAACNRYRRRIVRFETELEGYIPVLGDLCSIQSTIPGWGRAAEAVGWDAATRMLTLSERIVFESGARHYMGVRDKDGSMLGPFEVTQPADSEYTVVIDADEAPPGFHTPGVTRERTHVVIGPSTTYTALFRVTRVTPVDLYRVRVEGVVEDPAVHTATNGRGLPPINYSSIPKNPKAPVVKNVQARQTSGSRITLAWDPAPGATNNQYEIEFAHGLPDDPKLDWSGGAVIQTTSWHGSVPYSARTCVRVRALGLVVGPWTQPLNIGDLLGYQWSAVASLPMWSGDAELMWEPY